MKSGAGSGGIQPQRPGCPISALKGFGDEDRRLQGAAAAFDEPLTYTGDPTPLTLARAFLPPTRAHAREARAAGGERSSAAGDARRQADALQSGKDRHARSGPLMAGDGRLLTPGRDIPAQR